MAKTLAIIFGIIFVLIGILGFIPNPLVGTGALFHTNAVHDIIHVLLGFVLLVVAFATPVQSALWLMILGVLYLLVALLGFFTASPLLGLVEVNGADNWLHVVLGLVLLLAGWWTRESSVMGSMVSTQQGQEPVL